MRTIKKIVIMSGLFLVLFGCASGVKKPSLADRVDLSIPYEEISGQYTYKRLIVFDFDQMNDYLLGKVNKYQNLGNVQELKEAAMTLLSRPDSDGVVAKLISVVRNPMEDEGQWEATLIQLVRMSIDRMKKENVGAAEQVTYGIILENILSEIRPTYIRQYHTGGLETELIEYIAEQNPKYSKKALQDRALGIMKDTVAPGLIAQRLIESKEASLKAEAKRKKKQKSSDEEAEVATGQADDSAIKSRNQNQPGKTQDKNKK